jgi:endonuclease YncB( thermonuclease family)
MGICNSKNNVKENNLNNLTDDVELFTLENKIVEAKIVRIYDGDTCFAVFYLNNQPVKFKIRMFGYDSPEMKPSLNLPNREKEIKKANLAKSELEKLVLNKIVRLECGDWDKYGRLLGKIYVKDSNNREIYVNEHMVVNGHGYSYFGGTKKGC